MVTRVLAILLVEFSADLISAGKSRAEKSTATAYSKVSNCLGRGPRPSKTTFPFVDLFLVTAVSSVTSRPI